MRRLLFSSRQYLLRNLNVKLPYATGGMPGSNPLKNVQRHAWNRYFYLLDIKSFYPNIKGENLAKVICSLSPFLENQEEQFFSFLRRYCLDENNSLLIGSPSSPDLANLYAGILLDEPLGELARKYNLTYTRYLDDMTFSSMENIGARKRQALRDTILQSEFAINHQKSQIHDLWQAPLVITGVGLDYGGKTFLPRHFLRRIRQMIYFALLGKESPAKVHGMMGAFYASTGMHRALNVTELRLVREYKKFCQLMKEQET